ncbi:MAG: hypothetical protein ACRC41_05380 [Sarcina sp.]
MKKNTLKEDELDDINLSKIKNSVVKAIKDYENGKSLIRKEDLDISELSDKELRNKINDMYINGAKNNSILKKLVISTIDKTVDIKGDIEYKALFKARRNSSPATLWEIEAGNYFYIFFSKEECIIYELDNYFRVTFIRKYKKEEFYLFFPYPKYERITILFNKSLKKSIYTNEFILYTNLSEVDEEFNNFMDKLLKLGFRKPKNITEKWKITDCRQPLSINLFPICLIFIFILIFIIIRI